jgi:hypothetical protein
MKLTALPILTLTGLLFGQAAAMSQPAPKTVPTDHWVVWSQYDPVAETNVTLAAVTAPAGFVVAIGCQTPPVIVQGHPVPIQMIIPKDAFFLASLGFQTVNPLTSVMVAYITDNAKNIRDRTVREVWFAHGKMLSGTGRSTLSKAIAEAKTSFSLSFEGIGPIARNIGGPFPIALRGAKEAIGAACKASAIP